jgi:hypothetical protein
VNTQVDIIGACHNQDSATQGSPAVMWSRKQLIALNSGETENPMSQSWMLDPQPSTTRGPTFENVGAKQVEVLGPAVCTGLHLESVLATRAEEFSAAPVSLRLQYRF